MPESRSSLAVPPVETSSTPKCGELAGKIYQSGFVGNAKNGALDFRHEALGSRLVKDFSSFGGGVLSSRFSVFDARVSAGRFTARRKNKQKQATKIRMALDHRMRTEN